MRKVIPGVAATLLLDAGLAVAAYLVALALGASTFAALVAGAAVAGLRALYVIIRRREVDAFSLFVVATFVIGLILALFGGTPRFLLAKDSISTAASGLIFLATLIAGRPMMYYLSLRFGAGEERRLEWQRIWPASPRFRAHFRRQTLVWAIALLVEAVLKLALVLTLPVALMAPIVPFITPLLVIGLLTWTIRDSTRAEGRLRADPPGPEVGPQDAGRSS